MILTSAFSSFEDYLPSSKLYHENLLLDLHPRPSLGLPKLLQHALLPEPEVS